MLLSQPPKIASPAVAAASHSDLSVATALRAALLAHADLLRDARRIWVGYSGGADSTALLFTLTDVLPELDIRASHLNHGVQSEALDWVAHCRAVCARLKVPLDVAQLRPPTDRRFVGGFEAWARNGRYAHWQQLLGERDLLLLAHHQADQQETVALRLLQGRLPLPMPVSRPIGSGGARLLRPWLDQPGEQTRALLAAIGESWIEDPSNASVRMLRNRLRQQLLPALQIADPTWSKALNRCGDLTRRLIDNRTRDALSRAGTASDSGGEMLRLPVAALACPQAVLAILRALAPVAGRHLGVRQIVQALGQLQRQLQFSPQQANRSGQPLQQQSAGQDGEGALALWLADDGVTPELLIWRQPPLVEQSLQLSATGALELELAHGWLRIQGAAEGVYLLRTPRPGDRLRRADSYQPLREVLRAGAVPRWARASYPVLCDALGTSVVAVPAYVKSDWPMPQQRIQAADLIEAWFRKK